MRPEHSCGVIDGIICQIYYLLKYVVCSCEMCGLFMLNMWFAHVA